MKGFFVFYLLAFYAFSAAFAQQTISESELQSIIVKDKNKEEASTLPVIKNITLLNSENGQKSLLVVNQIIRAKLFNSSEKRNEITDLPGFISLGILSSENEMRICIQEEYVNQYLIEYFGFTETELINYNY